jgi:hypothetical protein
MGYLPEQARALRWHDERMLLEGLMDERPWVQRVEMVEVGEQPEPTDDLGDLEALGVTVRQVD